MRDFYKEMNQLAAVQRRSVSRTVVLDRALEILPLFKLSDSADDSGISYTPPSEETGGVSSRWRVLPNPGDRLPGTFDQDVYIEILRRYHDSGSPENGVVSFTLHSFLRSIARRVDGRTYEQLRSALTRLERTTLESQGAYFSRASSEPMSGSFTILSSVKIERRRLRDRDQLALFSTLSASEPGDAKVTVSPFIRANIAAGHTVTLSTENYMSLSNPVARRLYRLLEVARAEGHVTWRVPLEKLAEQLPLSQRYPSHLQRVLQPANEMLVTAGLVRDASIKQVHRDWFVDYVLALRG